MSQLLKKNSSVIIRYCMGFFLFTQIDRKKMLGYVYTTPQVTPGMKTTLDRASVTAAIFKEYFGMPRRHEHDPIHSHQYLRALFEPLFL